MTGYTVQIRISRETRDRLEGLRDQMPEGVGLREIGDIVGMLSLASPAQIADIFSNAMILLAANPAWFEDEEDEEVLDAEAAEEVEEEMAVEDLHDEEEADN